MLKEHITDEVLVDILLENQSCQDYDMGGISGELLTLYCMQQCGVGASSEEVRERVTELLASYINNKLVSEGLQYAAFEDGEISYLPTEEGIKFNEMIKGLMENSDV